MKNELKWETGENGSFPMVLEEKGLGLEGFSKFFFYFCGTVSLLSMIWVIVVSIGAFALSNQDPTTPESYRYLSLGCIALSLFCIKTLITFYTDKKNHYKYVEINQGKIKFKETSKSITSEWEEKIRKYTSVNLRHFTYRGVIGWYIVLNNPNKERNIVLFVPEYQYQKASEEDKKTVLEEYGKLFNLPTNYLSLEACQSQSNSNQNQLKAIEMKNEQ